MVIKLSSWKMKDEGLWILGIDGRGEGPKQGL